MDRRHFVKGNGDMDYIAYTSYLESKEQSLIKYLEDKIRELKYSIYKYDTWHELGEDKELMKLQVNIYQEILDKLRSDE